MRAYLAIALLQIITLVSYGQDTEKSKFIDRPDLPGKLMLDYGFNSLLNNPSEFGRNLIQSKSVGLYYMREFFPINNISISVGAGLAFEKLSFNRNGVLSYDDDILSFATSSVPLEKSKLAMNYAQIPIELRYYPGGEGKGSRFFIGGGAYVGYLLNAHTKLVYGRGSNISKEKKRSGFGLNKVRYGFNAKLGFDSVHLNAKFDLSELFESSLAPLDDGNANVWSLGLSIDTF